MASSKIRSVDLLPVFLQTDRNSKFLAGTLDQLIQPAELERLDGYIGSTATPNYNPTSDIYISETLELRGDYQLSPAMIVNDELNNVQDVQGLDDLINEISIKGGITNNLDRLLRSEVYSYNPHIDLDKFVNYQNYFWLPLGPELIEIETDHLDIDTAIVGSAHYTSDTGVVLSNGMLITFGGMGIPEKYHNKEFFVEGVGTAIVLVPFDKLTVSDQFSFNYVDYFDNKKFDNYGFDSFKQIPTTPEYVTINRASQDLNPWTRYNRWVHKDVIDISAAVNGIPAVTYPLNSRAQRPIIEFNPNIKLFNYGTNGITSVDLFDNTTTDAFSSINGAILTATTATVFIDNVIVKHGDRIVFNADTNPDVRGKIYTVNFVVLNKVTILNLVPDTTYTPANHDSINVLNGSKYKGSSWWYNGTNWNYSQQRTALNQSPLFDLYDINGNSYGDNNYYRSNFSGTKLFGYKIGTGSNDPYLGFPISYRNTDIVGSYLFSNYLASDTIVISRDDSSRYTISARIGYCKLYGNSGDTYENSWAKTFDYPIPLIQSPTNTQTLFYQEPLGLTNNPLNGFINEFTISEIGAHLKSMTDRIPNYSGNLRDTPNYINYGTELISNANPIAFSQMFLGKKEHSVIDAITKTADQYNQFKFTFLNAISNVYDYLNPVDAVDQIMKDLNKNKSTNSPYYLSDMLGYGTDKTTRTWTIQDYSSSRIYPLNSEFSLDTLNSRAVLIYLNNKQLTYGTDYVFIPALSSFEIISVEILNNLTIGDTIVVNDYTNTEGSYIPPTPTKLGLYPKFQPQLYVDDTYTTATNVIQGHDGSIMVAFNDYRDNIVLELEKRIYNNIKAEYRKELFDINSVMPGAFRTNKYTLNEVNEILETDLARWAGQYGVDYTINDFIDLSYPKTWNFTKAYNTVTNTIVSGSIRAAYKYFYDTDRPHTCPWEMLGFSEMPSWWTTAYGSAPYTSGNTLLWQDLALGQNANTGVIDTLYARPHLMSMLPVDTLGNLVDPTVNLLTNITPYNIRQPWVAGDQGPYETAWRRSSYWPFVVQKLLALTAPSTYTSLMYDPSRVKKNIAGQWTYGADETFFRLSDIFIFEENNTLTNGYSVMISEIGQQRSSTYLSQLRNDVTYLNYNLFHKVGGFVNKNTLQILIDAYDPSTNSPGALLPQENYQLRLNVSNPVKSIGISGFVIQKSNGNFIVRGYDRSKPYFTYYKSIRNSNTQAITVGGVSEPYVTWAPDVATGGATGLSDVDVTTANAAVTGHFYQKGQLVFYGTSFYRVQISHRSGSTFNTSYFQILSELPSTGGATVQLSNRFEPVESKISYGSVLTNIQDVYDLIIGYGRWLEDQGFIFDQYNKDLGSVIDWKLTAREFLFWTTQNWADNSIITLSPFADQIKYQFTQSVVDNIFDSFYEYSLLKADGTLYPQKSLSIARSDGVCTIATVPGSEGIYFARLNSVQKEHAIVFDNKTIFNDVIYDVETGSRQRRMKLVGFRTASWNGDYFSPGFVYDTATITDWTKYTAYKASDVVRFNGNYYAAINNIDSAVSFDFTKWNLLGKKPVAGLLPNFDYKINQFEDFYSLDIDNFDVGQQKMAQHLIGYTPRAYLNNLFTDPISQYKFYQGFIREKGTKNSLTKLARASIANLHSEVNFNEEWAFRVGQFGSFLSYQEIETPLVEGTFLENPQIVKFVDSVPTLANDLIYYSKPDELLITPSNYVSSQTFASTSSQDVFLLTHSGFVRIDDVTATAYNQNSLLDIATNSNLTNGDTIWLGFKQDGDWDVYRYTYLSAGIVGVYVSAPVSEITFTTDADHGLTAGDIISIVNFNDQVNGIYIVKYVPNSTQFSVPSTLSSITDAPLLSPGRLYKFASARIDLFDSIPADSSIYHMPSGTKFWVNSSPTNTTDWSVYEKIQNYNSSLFYNIPGLSNQSLGASISKRRGSDIIVAGAPTYYQNNKYGEIFVFKESSSDSSSIVRFQFSDTYTDRTEFGASVIYDDIIFNTSTFGLIFAGAPGAYNSSGTVKISSINPAVMEEGNYQYIVNPSSATTRFGSSLFVQRNTSSKLVLVGAPGIYGSTTTAGEVHAYTVTDDGTNIQISNHVSVYDSTISLVAGSQWGYSVSGSEDASYVAVGAPGYSTGTGVVTVFNKSLNRVATINSPFGISARFGESVAMSALGDYLFVSAPFVDNGNQSFGRVAVYKNNNNLFSLDQVLTNPIPLFNGQGMNFGKSIDIDATANTLIISSVGVNDTFKTTFDQGYAEFDAGVTDFVGSEINSGAVYVYYREYNRFLLAEELLNSTISTTPGTDFGKSIVLDNNSILVGAPAYHNTSTVSGFYKFDKINPTKNSWDKIRSSGNLTEVNSVQKISLIDLVKEDVLEYLEIIDPLKGKIAGIAEQELTYKLISDPAIYSVGLTRTINDTNINWLDEHVGELWWDLSTAKYLWYEQSDLEYRRNNWGKLFPGATIDVYEWVSSTLLPSEWSSVADTTKGLAQGISGQPKYADNSVISVKQVYDSITNSFSNVYFYWVKNKITVPSAKNRRISSYEVSSIIADPTAYGLKFASIISPDAIALSNVAAELVGTNVSLNIVQDNSEESRAIPRHTEWIILQENSDKSMPNALLEKKLIDSLLGHDSLGNPVPDPALTSRTKYGIGIRPQQTLFKDRFSALRNIVEFVNGVLINQQVTGKYNFSNLNSQESPPLQGLGEYDLSVLDNDELYSIDTSLYQTANIQLQTNNNGNITGTNIISPGYGYGILNPVPNNTGTFVGPTLILSTSSGSGAVLATTVDVHGQLINVAVLDGGTGYTNNFYAQSRPHTIIVQSDAVYNGKWTQYEFDQLSSQWQRKYTQKYNTTLYWKYVDWISADYNKYQDFVYTVDDLYGIYDLKLSTGQYVKIKNQGDGRYAILKKIDSNAYGTFGQGFDIVYNQNGTIQLLNNIWNFETFGFDYENSFDQTLWDQHADIELQYILTALKKDIFINDLKINWNLLFFKSVKYAMTEQRSLDWVFKTSFINVLNNSGSLDQRPLYKLKDLSYFEKYISEIKPYRTEIRKITDTYSTNEPTSTYSSDFDLPIYLNTLTNSFDVINSTTSTIFNSYPWKSWADNYLLPDNPIRKNTTKIKFDRTSTKPEILDLDAQDIFIGDGYTVEFELNWPAQPDKMTFQLTLGGVLQLSSDFRLSAGTKKYNGYTKKYSVITFLTKVPAVGQVVQVDYKKNYELLNATDRILNSYSPTPGMPGVDLGQLMTGVDYPGVTVGGKFEGSAYTGFGYVQTQNTVSYQSTKVWPNSFGEPDTIFNPLPTGSLASWDTTTISGIDPNELILDGENGFVTPNTSFAPEEVIPGQVLDSLGINVYTKSSAGAPIVFNRIENVESSTSNQYFNLIELPTTIDSISVVYLENILQFVDDAVFTGATQYSIDWGNKLLVLPPQSQSGILGYSIISAGGGNGSSAGVLDHSSITVTNASTAMVQSLTSYDSVNSAFVSVNGRPIPQVPNASLYGFKLVPVDPSNNRAAVQVYNLSSGTNTIQAWFFTDKQQYFNSIHEQVFSITSATSTSIPLALTYPPGNIEPVSAQSIVEITDSNGTRRLLPPGVNYYSVTDPYNPVFPVTVIGIGVVISDSDAQSRIANETVTVYQNGSLLRTGYDFVVDGASKTVIINTASTNLKIGDAIAIETSIPTILGTNEPVSTGVFYNYNYRIVGSNLFLAPGIQTPPGGDAGPPGLDTITNATIKVITYIDNDGSLMHTERFTGTSNRRFRISRPVFNTNYVWVTIFRRPVEGTPAVTYGLINNIDFVLLDDNLTIQINDSWNLTTSDIVEVISFSSQRLSSTILGYRIFNDMLGRTTFTRLSSKNSTYLTRALSFTDTEIHVAEGRVLTAPIVSKNIPGVILINGERIEFFQQNNNVLSQLRRATLGTGPSYYLEPGTRVLDQGLEQIIPFAENVSVQNTFTNTLTNQYVISKTSQTRTDPVSGNRVLFDGIVLTTATTVAPYDPVTKQQLTTPVNAVDQVDVFYGGRKLRKQEFYYHDLSASYDSISPLSILGVVTSTSYLSTVSNVGDSYLVSSLGEVWTYNGSRTETTSTQGYVFSGLRYAAPEFTINTQTQTLILNTSTIHLDNNIQISIVKKDFSVSSSWNDADTNNTNMTLSLLDSNNDIAMFLKDSPAELPNSYYYGGDLELTDEGGNPLFDNNGNDLKGYY